jgi:hypothetical protein
MTGKPAHAAVAPPEAPAADIAGKVDAAGVSTAAAAEAPPPGEENMPNFPDFRLRPFQAVKSSATHQWTQEDCLTDEAIRALAHNPLEEERYKNENKWTKRRQLVYRNEWVGDFLPQFENGTRTEIRVPGFDGTEFVVDIKAYRRFNDAGGGAHGTIRGYPGSEVNIGFAEGRESMEINIPSEGLLYHVRPRENNEVVINEIDPKRYGENQPRDHVVNNDDVGAPLQ